MNLTFIYALVTYFFYHLFSRSDILAKPRNLAFRYLPSFITYPFQCAFCFTFWASIAISLFLWFFGGQWGMFIGYSITASVINYLIDLWVRKSLLALSPPVIVENKYISSGTGCVCRE